MKVFLSSTYNDLVEHRKAAHDALEQLGLHVIWMEAFGARPEDSKVACLKEVEESDLFVGIYAHRYGWIPANEEFSITEQEFNHAQKLSKPTFGFIVDDDFIWHQKHWEHDKKAKLDAFLSKVKTQPVEFFTTPDNLAQIIAASVGRHIAERRTINIYGNAHATETPSLSKLANVPPNPQTEVQVSGRAISDVISQQDYLGFADYVEALAQFIENKSTQKPITIGIDAPWGGGKSTMMRMLEARLCPQNAINSHWWSKKKNYGFYNVWFNAWKFDEEDSLWSSLVLETLKQVVNKLGWWQRWQAWVRLNKKRFDWSKLFLDLIKSLGFILVLSSLGLVALFGLTFLLGISLSETINVWLRHYVKVLAGLSLLSLLYEILKDVTNTIISPFSLGLYKYNKKPDYKSKIGFIGQFQEDFKSVIDSITESGKRPLVVFIDDLDRCSPAKTASVIEAINLVLDSQYCIFIIGMDINVLSMSIQAKYKELQEIFSSAEKPIGPSLGRHFLEKIIQINFRIPIPGENHINDFIDAYLKSVNQQEQNTDKLGAETLKIPFEESEVVKNSTRHVASYLDFNPRQIKRFINLYRLQALIAHQRGLLEKEKGIKLDSLARWILINMRWPEFFENASRYHDFPNDFYNLVNTSRESLQDKISSANTGIFTQGIRNLLNNQWLINILKEIPLDEESVKCYMQIMGTITPISTPEVVTSIPDVQPPIYQYPIYPSSIYQSSKPTGNTLPQQPYFFGRADELKAIITSLSPDSRTWGVLIDGPGGIGKTALAIKAAHDAPEELFERKIFITAKVRELTPEGEAKLTDFTRPTFLAMLDELGKELGEELSRLAPDERPNALRLALAGKKALIIFDNLETLPEEERTRLFQFLSRLPEGNKAIVTSRRRTDVDAHIVRLDRLARDEALQLLAELATKYPPLAFASQKEREDLYEITQGNPLFIRWIAGQLGSEGSQSRTIAEACAFIDKAPKGNDPLEYIFGDLLETFTADETKVLAALTYFSLPAKLQWIADMTTLPERAAETALEDLTDRSILISNIESRTFFLPPLTAKFIRTRRPEAVSQIGDALTDHAFALAQEYGGESNYEGFGALEAKWDFISAALPRLLVGDNDRLQSVCSLLDQFLDFTGRWDEWLWLSEQAEMRAIAADDKEHAGMRAYQTGMAYSRHNQPDLVLACATRAAEYWKETTPQNKVLAIRLRGVGYELQKDYPAAISAYREALEIHRIISPESVATAFNGLAEAERAGKDYPAAERDYREALRIAKTNKNDEFVASITGNLAELALDREQWAEAESFAREALALAEKVGRLELIAGDCRRLAYALLKQNKNLEEALPLSHRAVEIFTRLRHPNLQSAQETLEEIEKAVHD